MYFRRQLMAKVLANAARWTTFVAIAVVTACAGDVGEVDRVQPGYVKKSDLLAGSWYYRRTIVDTPEGSGAWFTVGQGDLFTIERVRFDVQEQYVYAYRDYEYVPNSEGLDQPGSDYHGSPVAAFPVEQHFDIIFDYNAQTGEKTNVRVENTTDRQWFEREYVRVNWAVNENPNFDFLIPLKVVPNDENDGVCDPGEAQTSADCSRESRYGFYIHPDEANNPWRARLRPDQGYLDFVVSTYIEPDPWTCYSEYEFTDVFFNPNYCGAGEVRVRHAFTRVDDNSYQALYYPDSVTLTDASGNEMYDTTTGEVVREPIFDRFGAYRLEKLTYDDERGLTESGRLYRGFRFDIWRQGRNANGPIPYEDREVKPIVYYLNYDFPDDLKTAAGEVAAEWNVAFQKTVASLQSLPTDNFVCPRNASGAPIDANDPDCRLPNVFVLKENSCNLGNLRGYLSAHGSVREQVIASLSGEMSGSVLNQLLGSGSVAAVDEDTRHQYLDNLCAAAEYHSQDLSDPFVWQQIGDPRFTMMYWVPNIVPTGWSGYGPMLADPVTGRIVTATAYIMGWTIESQATRALEYIDYINGDLTLSDLLLGSNAPNVIFQSQYDPTFYTYDMQDVRQMGEGTVDAAHLQGLKARMQSLGGTSAERLTAVENSAHFAERLARIRGTEVERNFLTRPEDLMLASRGAWKPGDAVPEELWADASFVTRAREIKAKRDKVMRYFQERTMCPVAELDDALVGLAKWMKDQNWTFEQRRAYLKTAIFKAVMLHEVGHNVGMRHNFAGSYDALNYPRWFWDVETAGLTYEEKLDQQQPEYMYSSIMDYHGKTNADFHGLGLYDHAFVKFMYGQLVERFNDASVDGSQLRYDPGTNLKPPTQRFKDDYTKLPQTVGSVASMYDRSDVSWDWENERTASAVQTKLANEVPYMFCSDEYANWTPSCKRFDFGANQREVQAAAQVRYKNYFLFTNFLRYRLFIDFDAVVTRGYTTFLDTVLTYQYMYLYASQDPSFLDSTDAGADMATAVGRGLNLMSEVLAMPAPQYFHRCVRNPGPSQEVIYYPLWMITGEGFWDPVIDPSVGTGPEGEACDIDAELGVPLGAGLPLFLGFSEDFTNWTFTYLGTYWDKLFALVELTDPLATFPRYNHYENLSSFSISFYRLYPDVVNNILLSLIEFDRSAITWYYDDTTPGGVILPRPALTGTGLTDYDADYYRQLPRIVPALARNLQFFSLLFGQSYLTSPLDETLDFGKHTRVWLRGGAEDFLGDAGFAAIPAANRAECTLPEAGRTFRAIRTASFDSEIDVAFTFVNRCVRRQQELNQAWTTYEQALADAEANPGDMALWQEAEERERLYLLADTRMRDTEQEMLYMRWVNGFYEYGLELGF